MTAEVVLMNKQAIALAADSAVTLGGGKIFNSANKLYVLAPDYPIGILIFNNAELMEIPWEIVIKMYRSDVVGRKKRFKTLKSCGDDFVAYLIANKKTLFTDAQQRRFIGRMIQVMMEQDVRATIRIRLQELILATAAKVDDNIVKKTTSQVIEEVTRPWHDAPDVLYVNQSKDELEAKFWEQYNDIFEDNYTKYLDPLPISVADKEKLKKCCVQWLYKERWFQSVFSGLVFAGYGDDELFPTCTVFQFEGMLCDSLKYKQVSSVQIDISQANAGFLPFAQDDMMLNVLFGIHPLYSQIMQTHMTKMVTQDIGDNVLSSIQGMSAGQKTTLGQLIANVGKFKLDETLQHIQQEARINYTDSIMGVLSALPKDELASMAETLVSITSFMRRVSNTQETVGGPIDVAVISKKDGFVWIKRKHYFEPEYNYHFFSENKKHGVSHDQEEQT